MGKFSDPPKPKEPEPLPPPPVADETAERAAREKAANRRRAGRRATILADVTQEDIENQMLGRPAGAAVQQNLRGVA